MNIKRMAYRPVIWKSALGAGGLLLILLYSSGTFYNKIPVESHAHPPGRPLPEGAPTQTAQTETSAVPVEVVGTIASEDYIHISARLTAHVQAVHASAGQRVKAGESLVQLDDRDLREQLAAADVQMQQAETEHRRTKQLFEAKAATEQAMTAAASALRSAQSQHAHMQVLLTYANLTAPIDGIVTDRRIEKGDLAAAGQVLMSVYDPFRLRLEAPVPLRLLPRLAMDQIVQVRIDYPARQLKGVVTGIVSEIDPASRTQLVKVRLENTGGDLPPGGFGRLIIPDAPRPALFVPATALLRVGQLEYMEVVENQRVMRRLVQAGPAAGDGRIEILSGLTAGEVYLINPARKE